MRPIWFRTRAQRTPNRIDPDASSPGGANGQPTNAASQSAPTRGTTRTAARRQLTDAARYETFSPVAALPPRQSDYGVNLMRNLSTTLGATSALASIRLGFDATDPASGGDTTTGDAPAADSPADAPAQTDAATSFPSAAHSRLSNSPALPSPRSPSSPRTSIP
jgi:hypothetical protein